MSFGFAVGDFIEVGKLLYNIIGALRGAKSEYQELVRELENLRQALDHVDKLKGPPSQALTIDSIKLATLTCRHPLEEFQAKIVKHEKGLGLGKSEGRLKDAGHRVQWGLGGGRNSEVNRLRNYLNVHLNIINTLLLKQGLEQLDIASEQRQTNQNALEKSIKDSLQGLRDVRQNVEEQVLAVRENKTILQTLLNIVGGHIDAPLKALTGVVTKVCVSTQQIYNIVLEIRENTRGIDTRFTYFQNPVQVEDVLGRIFPFPAEFSILTLEAEILNRFKQGPGQSEVAAGSYEIFNSQNTNELLETSAGSILRPGMSVSMSVIIESKVKEENRCPVAHCQSIDIIGTHGGKRCLACDFWFKSGGKKRKSLVDPECNSHHFDKRKRSKPTGSLPKLQELGLTTETILEGSDGDLDSLSVFKRVSFVQGPADPERTNYFQDFDPELSNEEQNRPPSPIYFHHWQPPAGSNGLLRRQSVARTNEEQNRPSSPLYFHHWHPPDLR